jgi:hypothetical protein
MYVGTQSGCLTDLKAALEGAAMMDGTTAAPESAVDCRGKVLRRGLSVERLQRQPGPS